MNNNNASFTNTNIDNKLVTPLRMIENNTGSLKFNKIKEDQNNLMNNKNTSVTSSKHNINNNLMNNFLMKSKEQEKSNSSSNNNSIKSNIGVGGINFNNNINYLNLVSNLGNNPNDKIKKFK